MAEVVGVVLGLLVGALLVGVLTGRVRSRSCCAVGDPRHDLRMRAAWGSEEHPGVG
jgi:hypothetical protein